MTQINVPCEVLQGWFQEGQSIGALMMTIVTDTFSLDVDQTPRYTMLGEPEDPLQWLQLRGETFDLRRPFEYHMARPRVPDFPCGCSWGRPCGCGY